MPIPPSHVAQLRLESERRLALWATALMLLPGVLWAYVDVSLVSNTATLYALHAMRGLQGVLCLTCLYLIRRATAREDLQRVLFGMALAIVVFVSANAWLRPETNWMPLRVMVLISIGTFVVYPYPFHLQLLAWLALVAAAFALAFGHYATMPDADRFSALLTILLAGALGMVIARNRAHLDRDLDASLEREREAIAERERATAALRRLEGIIPICSYCHQVRTEAGAWEQLDQYVRTRTDADFSHGMCPACAQQNFPDLVEPAAGRAAPLAERI